MDRYVRDRCGMYRYGWDKRGAQYSAGNPGFIVRTIEEPATDLLLWWKVSQQRPGSHE